METGTLLTAAFGRMADVSGCSEADNKTAEPTTAMTKTNWNEPAWRRRIDFME
jgi:hypothetical protein